MWHNYNIVVAIISNDNDVDAAFKVWHLLVVSA